MTDIEDGALAGARRQSLLDRVEAEIAELTELLPRLEAEWHQSGEDLANAIVIRRHLTRNVDKFAPHEREMVADQAQQLAITREAAAIAITNAQERMRLLTEVQEVLGEEVVPSAAPVMVGALQVHQAVEGERLRIARDLHDGPAQVLTNLVLEADILERTQERDPEMFGAELQAFKNSVRNAVGDLRRFMFDLRPDALDDLGLWATLRRFTKEYQDKAGIVCRFNPTGEERRLPPDVEEAIYRVIQEALNNVRKHAGARSAEVSLSLKGSQLTARVADDGAGFDPETARPDGVRKLGVLGMRERMQALGGDLVVTSAPGQGTEITATVEVPPTTT